MRNHTTRRTVGALALSLALVGTAAACSDDDDTATEDEVTTTTAATDETMAEDEMSEDTMADEMATDDIVDTAVAAGDFETLVTAVQAAGLEETLRGEGPFTVFAPTDDAFAALPEGTLDSLLADPEGSLAPILTYHVVAGEVLAEDVVTMDGQEVETVNGATFTVNVGEDGSVSLTDAAGNEVGVVATDVMASNGVIHVIDGILMPS
jgi:uncharacterized surface protein with fasciclin (FAS1) repeats